MPTLTTAPGKPARWLIHSLSLALALALGLQIAWWSWHVLTPTHAPENGAPSENLSLARHLFGPPTETAAPSIAPTSNEPNGLILKGIYAASGKMLSVAVINIGGKDQAVLRGQEIASGLTLTDVQADHVIVSRRGIRERIDLSRFGTATPRSNPQIAQPQGNYFRLNVSSTANGVFSLSRQELNTVLQDPRQLNFLGRIGTSTNGGVRIDDAPQGSLSEKLGLKTGDLINHINGQPVNSAGDLARLYGQFGTLSEIRAEVMRGGTPVLLTYRIQN